MCLCAQGGCHDGQSMGMHSIVLKVLPLLELDGPAGSHIQPCITKTIQTARAGSFPSILSCPRERSGTAFGHDSQRHTPP